MDEENNLFHDSCEIFSNSDKQVLLSTLDSILVSGNDKSTAIVFAWPPEENSPFYVGIVGREKAVRALLVEAMCADNEVATLLHTAVAVHKAIAPTETIPQVHVEAIKFNKN